MTLSNTERRQALLSLAAAIPLTLIVMIATISMAGISV